MTTTTVAKRRAAVVREFVAGLTPAEWRDVILYWVKKNWGRVAYASLVGVHGPGLPDSRLVVTPPTSAADPSPS